MRKLFIIVVLAFAIIVPICAQDEVKRVAILKTVDEAGNVPLGVKLNLRSTLAYAISHMSGYEAYTRVNISEIMDEQKFQRTGYVSDSQIKKLGEMTGASYVLVAEAGYYDENNITVTATIIDVESARIVEQSQPEIASTEPSKMREACIQIARTLLGKDTRSNSNSKKNNSTHTQTKYVDLGLPSGTLWSEKTEDGLYTQSDALRKYGNSLPTITELYELYKCKWQVVGNQYKITGPNGNFILISANGNGESHEAYRIGEYGCYWSSHITEGREQSSSLHDSNGLGFYISDEYIFLWNYDPSRTMSVRLVKRN